MKSLVFRLLSVTVLTAIIVISCKKEFSCEGCNGSNQPPLKNQYVDSIRVDSIGFNCTMQIANLNNRLPPGVKFDVYIRYYWGTIANGYWYSGPFDKIDTIPDAQIPNQPWSAYWYWYEYSNGLLIIHYPHNVDCNFDPSYQDVMIKW